MLPSLTAEPPSSDHWIHEIKHDGFRTMLLVDGGTVRAFTRNHNDWTARYPGIVAAAAKLRCRSAILDGEVIVQDEAGRLHFDGINSTIRRQSDRLIFFAFDLVFIDGKAISATRLSRSDVNTFAGCSLHRSMLDRGRRRVCSSEITSSVTVPPSSPRPTSSDSRASCRSGEIAAIGAAEPIDGARSSAGRRAK